MRAYLHEHMRLVGSTLHDTVLGTRYTLSPDAAWLARQLMPGQTTGEVVRRVARSRRTGLPVAQAAVFQLLATLGRFGAVQIVWDKGWLERLQQGRAWLYWPVRSACTWRGFAVAVLRAYGGLAFASFASMFGISLLLGGGVAHVPLGIALSIPLILVASCATHELGHVVTARYYRTPVCLLSRFGYMATVYRRPVAASYTRHIALAGPMVAVVFCLVVALCLSGTMQLLVLITALLHVANIAPWFGDGKHIWRKHETTKDSLSATAK